MEGGKGKEWKGSAKREGSSMEQFIWFGSGGGAAETTRSEPSWVEELWESLEGCSVTPSAKVSTGSESEEDKAVGADVGIKCPLQNSLILKHLFGLCPPRLLAKFRRVSKQWHEESLASFRSSVWVKFENCAWGCGCFDGGFQQTSDVEKFLQFVEDSKNKFDSKPYRRFHLIEWDFKDENYIHLINRFWQACAGGITHLKLKNCKYDRVEGFHKIICDTCPNLQFLELEFRGDCFGRHKNYQLQRETENVKLASREHRNLKSLRVNLRWQTLLPLPWVELLSHFPSLTSLSLQPENMDTADDRIVEMLRAVQVIRKIDKKKLALKHLSIYSSSPSELYFDRLSPAVCALLRELQLPVEHIGIDLGRETEPGIVKDILELHGKMLKGLYVQRDDKAQPYSGFPFGVPLNNLEVLFVRNLETFGEGFLLLQATSNLRKLCILQRKNQPMIYQNWPNYFAPNSWNFAEDVLLMLPLLTELRIDHAVSVKDLRCLVNWMPNVERLTMLLNDEQFGIVCADWRKLIHLKVLGEKLTDEGVTGIENRMRFPVRPNITRLKNLQSFEMVNEYRFMDGLMDDSVFHGFLKVDSLHSLKLVSWMSDKAKKALIEKIPDCKIDYGYCDDYDDDRCTYADSILPGSQVDDDD